MEKKTSIFLIILLCILVAVAAGGSSYLVLAGAHDQETQALNDQADQLQSQLDKLQTEAKSTATTTATPTTTPATTTTTTVTPDPTAGWKTYNGNGYTFKYPSSWTAEKVSHENTPASNLDQVNMTFDSKDIYKPQGFFKYLDIAKWINERDCADCMPVSPASERTASKTMLDKIYNSQQVTKGNIDELKQKLGTVGWSGVFIDLTYNQYVNPKYISNGISWRGISYYSYIANGNAMGLRYTQILYNQNTQKLFEMSTDLNSFNIKGDLGHPGEILPYNQQYDIARTDAARQIAENGWIHFLETTPKNQVSWDPTVNELDLLFGSIK